MLAANCIDAAAARLRAEQIAFNLDKLSKNAILPIYIEARMPDMDLSRADPEPPIGCYQAARRAAAPVTRCSVIALGAGTPGFLRHGRCP